MPAITRALVLGAAGFLGSRTVQVLRARGLSVSAFFRESVVPCDADVVRGQVQDVHKLRHVIALHEIDCVFQCAAGSTPGETHQLTQTLLQAVAGSERKPVTVIPLRASASSSHPRFQSLPESGLKVVFAKLPELFGPGCCRGCWPSNLFERAQTGQLLLPPPRDVFLMDVTSAAHALVDAACEVADYPDIGRWIDPPATATSRELWQAVKDELGPRLFGESTGLQLAVQETMAWYQSNANRTGDRMLPRVAA